MKPKTALFWIAVGLLLIFLSLFLEGTLVGPEGILPSPGNLSVPGRIWIEALHALIRLAEVSGIACFVLGLIHIVIETDDWSEYFRERIREIVMEQSFLNTL